jgi:hypothetical protein
MHANGNGFHQMPEPSRKTLEELVRDLVERTIGPNWTAVMVTVVNMATGDRVTITIRRTTTKPPA